MKNELHLKLEKSIVPQYKVLQMNEDPIYVWGIGTLAVNILEYCQYYNIPLKGFIVNTGNIPHEFCNLPVLSFEEAEKNTSPISVIIGHNQYQQGIKLLSEKPFVKNVYCITSLCYGVWEPIPITSVEKKYDGWNQLYRILADEQSKLCLKTYLEARINDNPEYMYKCYQGNTNYYKQSFFHLGNEETLLDLGACVGNAIWAFYDIVKGQYKKIVAIEPEGNNYEILCQNIKDRQMDNVITKRVCVWEKQGQVAFQGMGERGKIVDAIDADSRLLPAITIDSLKNEANISIIKINMLSSIPEILKGGKELIEVKKPKLIIRVGFDETLMMNVYKTVKELNPFYRIYFRYTLGMPAGLTLYAI